MAGLALLVSGVGTGNFNDDLVAHAAVLPPPRPRPELCPPLVILFGVFERLLDIFEPSILDTDTLY